MADLSAYLKDCDVACAEPTCTEWNMFIQAVEDAVNNLEQGNSAIVDLTDEATVAVDWSNGPAQRIVVTANRTFTFANAVSGQKLTLIYVQDGSGGHTSPTWPASVRVSGGGSPTAPTTTANKTTYYEFIYNDSDGKYDLLNVSTNH